MYKALQADGFLDLKRGIGTFVAHGKKTQTKDKRQLQKLNAKATDVIAIAKELGFTSAELLQFIDRRWSKRSPH